jgi:hypothetical protein
MSLLSPAFAGAGPEHAAEAPALPAEGPAAIVGADLCRLPVERARVLVGHATPSGAAVLAPRKSPPG